MIKKNKSKYGDVRLDSVFNTLLERMSIRFTTVLRQLGDNHNEKTQFYRLMNNKNVTPDRMLEHYWGESPLNLCSHHILVINDSSTLTYSKNDKREELGFVGRNSTQEGFSIHPSVLINAEDSSFYGVGGISFHKTALTKTKEDQEIKLERRKNVWKLPFEEKERYKWLESPQKAINNCPDAKKYTLVGDRESDIYDLIAKTTQQGWEFLYRNKGNRRIEGLKSTTLYEEIKKWEIKHTYTIEVKETRKRTAHRATMDIKYGNVSIKKPRDNPDKSLVNQIELYIVEVKEKNKSVINGEKAIHWILLTSHRIDRLEQAKQIIIWYQWRWVIEQLFRTIKKQGLKIERSEIETYAGLQKLSVLALIAAAQVMQLVQARNGKTSETIDSILFEEEQKCIHGINKKMDGKTQKLKNPYNKNTLAYASWVIARLGGWSGYEKQRPPGPITFCKGLIRFYDILEGYYLFLESG